jgi:hypothetical protein
MGMAGREIVREPGQEALTEFQPALAHRVLIDQAIGIVAERLARPGPDAAATLAQHAWAHGENLVLTAQAVIAGMTPTPATDQADTALTALMVVCALADLDPRDAEPIRQVGNAVFRLQRQPVVVKVVPTPALAHRASTAVAAAGLLAAHGVPAVRLWPGVSQPVIVNGCAVTLWRYGEPSGHTPTIADLADLLARLHTLPVTHAALPVWDPIPDIRSRIKQSGHADPEDQAFLSERCDLIEDQLAAVRYVLPTVVMHGDAHLGNIIPSRTGPLWCDLDGVRLGPPEWDLVPVAVARLRFPTSVNTQQQLADTYGFDVTRWIGFPVLRALRELKLVTSALPAIGSNPVIRAEYKRRLRSIRTGDTHALWNRYP